MKFIHKKILPKYFEAVDTGQKTFEVRKDEDDIQPGDTLILHEWNGTVYTGRECERKVGFVLRDCSAYGLMDGFCVIALIPMEETEDSCISIVRCKNCIACLKEDDQEYWCMRVSPVFLVRPDGFCSNGEPKR